MGKLGGYELNVSSDVDLIYIYPEEGQAGKLSNHEYFTRLGQKLSQVISEHTASMPAILQFIQGEATVGLGDDKHEAKAGTWVHVPTGQRHSIQAKTPVVMLLLLLK